jgi:hypothetical protein
MTERLKKFLSGFKDSRSREYVLTTRLVHDLAVAAAPGTTCSCTCQRLMLMDSTSSSMNGPTGRNAAEVYRCWRKSCELENPTLFVAAKARRSGPFSFLRPLPAGPDERHAIGLDTFAVSHLLTRSRTSGARLDSPRPFKRQGDGEALRSVDTRAAGASRSGCTPHMGARSGGSDARESRSRRNER